MNNFRDKRPLSVAQLDVLALMAGRGVFCRRAESFRPLRLYRKLGKHRSLLRDGVQGNVYAVKPPTLVVLMNHGYVAMQTTDGPHEYRITAAGRLALKKARK